MNRISGLSIIAAVEDHYRLALGSLASKARYRRVARPRQVAMFLMRELAPHLSYPAIGRMMGGRDHTTIIHGVRMIGKLHGTDPDLDQAVLDIRRSLTADAMIFLPENWYRYSVAMRAAA